MKVSDAKRLRELEIENTRLKKLLADAPLENEVTREVLRMSAAALLQAGRRVNHQRVDRLYAEARLPVRRWRRTKVPLADRPPLVRPQTPNEVWSADFVFDRTAEGRVLTCLTIVDDATTEAVEVVPARARGGGLVTRVLEAWRREYNEERPKKGLGGRTPAAHAQQLTAKTKTATVTAGLGSRVLLKRGGRQAMQTTDRSVFQFARQVQDAFKFLGDAGFELVEACPTLVRYRKGDVEVDVCHGRQSYEVGGGVMLAGSRYSIGEIIRSVNPEVARGYRYKMATTPEVTAAAVVELAALFRNYASGALGGTPQMIALLREQRQVWAEEYALDVLAAQLRPQAAAAFRRGAYGQAAELYGRIQKRLSPSEIRKLSLSLARRAGRL